jgi:hypothetical protein
MSRQPSKGRRAKTRRTWAIRPVTRPHSTPKGKKGYQRERERRIARGETPDEGGDG